MNIVKVLIIGTISVLSLAVFGCTNPNTLNTFVLTEGPQHFSFEYRAYYKILEVEPGDMLDYFTYVTIQSPKIKRTKDYTTIDIILDKPDNLVPDAKSGIERSERNASSWKDYRLLDKYELTIDGLQAYRIDYQIRNIVPAIARVSDEPFITVYREVRFNSDGYVWMIQMESDSSTAEADKVDFEYILKSFKILN
jgi:hypothetical protein